MAILVIYKIGVGDSRFFPRGFRVKWGVWGGKKICAPKIVPILPGTVYEVPEIFFEKRPTGFSHGDRAHWWPREFFA